MGDTRREIERTNEMWIGRLRATQCKTTKRREEKTTYTRFSLLNWRQILCQHFTQMYTTPSTVDHFHNPIEKWVYFNVTDNDDIVYAFSNNRKTIARTRAHQAKIWTWKQNARIQTHGQHTHTHSGTVQNMAISFFNVFVAFTETYARAFHRVFIVSECWSVCVYF